MSKNMFLGYVLAFLISLLVAGGVVLAQTQTPSPSLSPLPTRIPTQAPATGYGWNK